MTGTTATKPTLPRAEPEAVGMSSTRLARIVPALNAEIEARQLPGVVIAVARHGRLFFTRPLAISARTDAPRCHSTRCSPSHP